MPDAESFVAPKVALWIGVGCRRGTSENLLTHAIQTVCWQHQLSQGAIVGLATLDTKAQEVGLLACSASQQWPITYFAPEVLKHCSVPHPSSVVRDAIGLFSVAEAAALMAAMQGADTALPPILVVPKQIFQRSQWQGAVTIAVAQARV